MEELGPDGPPDVPMGDWADEPAGETAGPDSAPEEIVEEAKCIVPKTSRADVEAYLRAAVSDTGPRRERRSAAIYDPGTLDDPGCLDEHHFPEAKAAPAYKRLELPEAGRHVAAAAPGHVIDAVRVDGGRGDGTVIARRTAYRKVYAAKRPIVEAALYDETIPVSRKDYLRRYFEAIRPAE